jgi:hypothetical protein
MRTAKQFRPICIEKDHRVALAEIEKLWGTSRCDALFSRCTR